MTTPLPRTALVLGGGGARGAYEAGVLRYLRGPVARELGRQPHFDIVCGTSIGAINACHLAMWADQPERQAAELARLWSELEIRQVLSISPGHLLKIPRWLTGQVSGRMSLVQSAPLERLVLRGGPWSRISRNINLGFLDALTVTATRVHDGMVTLFVEARSDVTTLFDPAVLRQAHRVRIRPRHALASAAIPLLFPAVPIGGQLYFDGGLRQNTPLQPALWLGAERVLVVSIDQPFTPPATDALLPDKISNSGALSGYPSAAALLGSMLDSLLTDPVERDLLHLAQVTALLDEAEARFGTAFVAQLRSLQAPFFGKQFRRIRALALVPGADLAALASTHLDAAVRSAGGLAGQFMQRLGQAPAASVGHLPSFYLFHGAYARDLIALAEEDCRRQHGALLEFFTAPGRE